MADSLGIITRAYMCQLFDKRRVLNLTDDGAGQNADIIDQAIYAAENEVYNTLSRQYELDDLIADPSIKRATATIAMHILELRRTDFTPAMVTAYNKVTQYLQRIVDGEIKLNRVEQLLPRITHTQAQNAFEDSMYFDGLPQTGDDGLEDVDNT